MKSKSSIKNRELLQSIKKERTLVLIKPDGVERKLVGEIISRFEKVNLRIVGLGIVIADKNKFDKHYPKDKKWIENLGNNFIITCQENNIDFDLKDLGVKNLYELGIKVREWLINYMASGPIVKIVLEGNNAIEIVRKIVGHTLPQKAQPGTIRGDFSIDSPIVANLEKRALKNLIHASSNKKEADKEIKSWFNKKELID